MLKCRSKDYNPVVADDVGIDKAKLLRLPSLSATVTCGEVESMARKSSSSQNGQIALFGNSDVPDLFRKAVEVIHSKPKQPLSLVQRKISNAWIKHALITEPGEDGWWSLGIRSLAEDIEFDSNNHQHLKTAAEALMSIVFEWDVIAPAAKRSMWKASVMFPEIEIHADVVKYQFSSQMRERLLNPEIYALIDMNVVKKFRRASSLALWEHCIRYEKIGRTGLVEWQLMRDIMLGQEATNKTYEEYKFFKSKVLKPSLAEIAEVSEHKVTMTEFRTGRRISSLQFVVERKQPEVSSDDTAALEVIGEMTKIGVPPSEAKRMAKLHTVTAIKAALAYTKKRTDDRKLPKLDSVGAYFRKALEFKYAADPIEPTEAPKAKVDIRQEFKKQQLVEADKYFQELDMAEQTALMDKYNSEQPTVSLRFTEKKKPSRSVLSTFFGWLAQETWGEPTPEELLQFAVTLISNEK